MWPKISTSQYTPPWIFDSPKVALNALWNCASYGWPRGLQQTSQVVFWWLKRMFTMWTWWGSIRTRHHFVSQILDDFWLLSNCGIAAQYFRIHFKKMFDSNHIPWIFHATYSLPSLPHELVLRSIPKIPRPSRKVQLSLRASWSSR